MRKNAKLVSDIQESHLISISINYKNLKKISDIILDFDKKNKFYLKKEKEVYET